MALRSRTAGTFGIAGRLMPMRERIVAIGLLTQKELSSLGPAFDRAWPIDRAPAFPDLIRAIDEAEERLRVVSPQPRSSA